MTVLDTIDRLRGLNAADRFLAFKTLLDMPADTELFYAFSAQGYSDRSQVPPPPGRLLLEPRTEIWWRDYAGDPGYRLRDPVRQTVREGFCPIVWRELADCQAGDAWGAAVWRRVWDLGVNAGVTIPLHDALLGSYGSLAAISFGRRREFEDWYADVKEMLPAQAYYFHHGLYDRKTARADEDGPLSKRERECLTQVAKGLCSKEIARNLGLSPRTVDLHVARGIRRLKARNRIEAVAIALKRGAIDF